MIHALLAALLFGTATTFSKFLLGSWHALPLAGTFYFSSGLGLLILRKIKPCGPSLTRADTRWIFGSVVCGGMIAPVALLYGLECTTGYAGALLVNLETVFTVLIAVTLFSTRLTRRDWTGIAGLLAGACVVGIATAETHDAEKPWLGAGLVALACLGWGFDNNFTERISGRDPLQIASTKSLVAGSINLAACLAFGFPFPNDARDFIYAALLGFFAFGGLSLVFFVLALRDIGSARTTAIFTASTVFGVATSYFFLGERPHWSALLGGAVMLASIVHMAGQKPPAPEPR